MISAPGFFPRPPSNVKPSELYSQEYGSRMARFIFSTGSDKGSLFGYSQYDRYSLYEDYATGRQSKEQYKRLQDKSEQSDTLDLKIDYTISKYTPKLISICINSITEQPLAAKYNSIDPHSLSVNQEMEARMRMLFDMKGHNFFAQQLKAVDPILAEIDLDSRDQLEAHLMTNPKDLFGMCMEQIDEYVMMLCDYDQVIDPMTVADMVVKGGMAAHDMVLSSGLPYVRRVDPKYLLYPYTDRVDGKDVDAAGYFLTVNRQEFREIAGEGMAEAEIEQIFKSYAGGPNAIMPGLPNQRYPEHMYDRLMVMRFFFIAAIEEVYEESRDKAGNLHVRKLSEEKMGRGKSDRFEDATTEGGVAYRTNGKVNVYRRTKEVVMEGLWIPSVEKIISYGPSNTQPKQVGAPDKARLPLHIALPHSIAGRPTSIVEQMVDLIDDLQLATLQMRALTAAYVPPQIAVNVDALEAVGERLGHDIEGTALNVVRAARRDGILYYSLRDISLDMNLSDPMPIREVGSTHYITHINAWHSQMAQIRQQLHEIIGLNAITAASTPPERQGKAVGQMMIQATSMATRHYSAARQNMRASVSRAIGQRAQQVILEGRHHGLANAVGERAISFLLQNPHLDSYRFGVKVEAAPTYQEWAEIYQQAAMSLGQPNGITQSELMVMRQISNAKQLTQYLRLQETKRARQQRAAEEHAAAAANQGRMEQIQLQGMLADDQARRDVDAQTQILEKQAELAALLEEVKFILKTQASTQNITQKAQSNVLLENARAENRIREQQAKSQ